METKNIKKIVSNYIDKNLSVVDGWKNLGEDQISHIKDIANSIILAREGIISPSGFVNALLKNDLKETISLADSDCMKALKLFIFVKLHVIIE